MANRRFALIPCLALIFVLSNSALFAQEPFFKGKTVRIIVGFTPGGGYDTYARLIGRHLGNHVPGNPTVVVENMPGAGSLISANYIYRVVERRPP